MSNYGKETKEEKRLRKKRLISSVKEQFEFYFSPANLSKDLFLQELLSQSEYISLDVFRNFNKLKKLTLDINTWKWAIQASDVLELSEDETSVRRKEPMQEKLDELDCTVYVENLPDGVEHDWIKKVFSKYGAVDYVSLPRFKETSKPKGFAFVEFHTPQEAYKAVMAYGNINMYDPGIKPEDLCSIRTYDANAKKDSVKRNRSPDDCTEVSLEKKLKLDDRSKVSCDKKPDKKTEIEETNKKNKKKSRKKKPKKNREEDMSVHSLTVMSKRCWKRLRNEYLDLQKVNKNSTILSAFLGYPNAVDTSTMPVYTPGVIVKILLEEPPADAKKLKQEIKTENIVYVDCKTSSRDMFLRFANSVCAESYVKEGKFRNAEILTGQEENTYWESITTSWLTVQAKKKNKKEEEPTVSKQ